MKKHKKKKQSQFLRCACKMDLEQWFNENYKTFWENRIIQLPEKWVMMVEQNNQYLVQ